MSIYCFTIIQREMQRDEQQMFFFLIYSMSKQVYFLFCPMCTATFYVYCFELHKNYAVEQGKEGRLSLVFFVKSQRSIPDRDKKAY